MIFPLFLSSPPATGGITVHFPGIIEDYVIKESRLLHKEAVYTKYSFGFHKK